ncbi:hypothetical protein SAMN05443549_10941 [Flavobacterium fluvii]|uniref:Uncharacterized protein n=1 Tax=Flavobacterium fluvii TaxID=468056 RepID=A0A1M5P2F9_9FLAO|nr:hypothetical protein SAMN05443549_10941 [Flavobacterium fluvii]
MKMMAQLLLFVFITFLATPTVVSVIKKGVDTSIFYSFSEEEKAHKEIKAIFYFDTVNAPVLLSNLNSGLIHSENLSKHDKIASKIFIPPPEQA